jgi:hypothetical protein
MCKKTAYSGGWLAGFQFAGKCGSVWLRQGRSIRKNDGGDTLEAQILLPHKFSRLFVLFDIDIEVGDILFGKNPTGTATITTPGNTIKHDLAWGKRVKV